MSLVDNARDVAFTTRWPTDKIVGVWEGSYNRATDVIFRTYTFSTVPYDVYFYRIPHGFTRPVFCDLLWSNDGVIYVDGGSGGLIGTEPSIAFSDSTYIYIYDSQGVAATGTAYYKVIAFWIDSYDGTNPLVSSYISSNKDVLFSTENNYQKIYLQGTSSFNFSAGVASSPTNSIAHGLGYMPNFRVFYEAFANEVWPMQDNGTFLFADDQLACTANTTTSNLNITIDHPISSSTTSARAWYRLYLDE